MEWEGFAIATLCTELWHAASHPWAWIFHTKCYNRGLQEDHDCCTLSPHSAKNSCECQKPGPFKPNLVTASFFCQWYLQMPSAKKITLENQISTDHLCKPIPSFWYVLILAWNLKVCSTLNCLSNLAFRAIAKSRVTAMVHKGAIYVPDSASSTFHRKWRKDMADPFPAMESCHSTSTSSAHWQPNSLLCAGMQEPCNLQSPLWAFKWMELVPDLLTSQCLPSPQLRQA